VLSVAEQDWRDGSIRRRDLHAGTANRCDPTAEADVFTVGGFAGAFQCSMNAVGDEVEGRAAVHGD
jgi:hypothetical protein